MSKIEVSLFSGGTSSELAQKAFWFSCIDSADD